MQQMPFSLIFQNSASQAAKRREQFVSYTLNQLNSLPTSCYRNCRQNWELSGRSKVRGKLSRRLTSRSNSFKWQVALGSHLEARIDAAILIRNLDPFRQARPVWDRAAEMLLVAATTRNAADVKEA